MSQFEHYWLFAAVCLAVALLLIRLVIKERVTLQGSLAFLIMLTLGASICVFPDATRWVAVHLGFALPSNFFFAVALGALGVLHVNSLIMHSRISLRSVALTQELAILQERLDRLQRDLRVKERQAS